MDLHNISTDRRESHGLGQLCPYRRIPGQQRFVSGGQTVNKATPTATLAVNNSPQTYDGTAKSATVAITVSSVPGAVANILTGGTATKTTAGTYAVTADFVPTDTANYNTPDRPGGGELRDQQGDADGDAGGEQLAADL